MVEYPRLRPVEAFPSQVDGKQVVCLKDPQGFTDKMVFLPYNLFYLVGLFDGQHSILDTQAEYARKFGDLIFGDQVRRVVEQLDEHLFLDSDRYREHRLKLEEDFRHSAVRRAAHAGTAYEADPDRLLEQMDGMFKGPAGPGMPAIGCRGARLKAAVVPHIDPCRGASCYARGYKEIGEAAGVDVFVILGTDHYSGKAMFSGTCKAFETPLGVVETDRGFVDRLAERFREADLLGDEFSHRSEHSIEFQVVLLQYLFSSRRPFRVVAVLCGSFQEVLRQEASPTQHPVVGAFMQALRGTISEWETSGVNVCLIAAADLAHVGRRFGDQAPITLPLQREVEIQDREMLGHVTALDPDGLFRAVKRDGDSRRICGFPAIMTLLGAVDAAQCELLEYNQAVDPSAESLVSFAALAMR